VRFRFRDSATNETGFKIYDAISKKLLKTLARHSGTGYVYGAVTGLKPKTKYSLYVVAVKGNQVSGKSNIRTFKL